MVKARLIRSLLCGALAIAGTFALLQPAEAGAVRFRFTPPYGEPFPNLYWFGEAVVDDGGCGDTGNVSNLVGGCAGDFTITSATVKFAYIANPNDPVSIDDPDIVLQTLDFEGGQVISVQRQTTAASGWREIISTPFDPQYVDVSGLFEGEGLPSDPDSRDSAYFSLIFVGGYAQLFWFAKDPGPFGDPWWNPLIYKACYLAGPGRDSHCGLSAGDEEGSNGARLIDFVDAAAVPEPGTLALLLAAALGAAGLRAGRRYL